MFRQRVFLHLDASMRQDSQAPRLQPLKGQLQSHSRGRDLGPPWLPLPITSSLDSPVRLVKRPANRFGLADISEGMLYESVIDCMTPGR